MGSFRGHIVPGSFFIVFGCWWLPNIFYRFYKSKQQKGSVYKNTATFPGPYSDKCLPIQMESYIKLMLAIIGILLEFFTAFDNGGNWDGWGNVQHMCMYFFFGINGLIEVSNHTKWDIPIKLDYLSAAISFGMEGFLFYHHLDGRPPMNIMMHMFLFYAIFGCFVACLFEMVLETNMVPALFRAYFTLLQGTWFYQIAFTLYSPFGVKWDEHDHEQIMIIPSLFALHIAGLLLVVMGIGAVVRVHVLNSERKLRKDEKPYASATLVDLDLSGEESQPLHMGKKDFK